MRVAFLHKGDNPLPQREGMWFTHLLPPYLLKDMESRIRKLGKTESDKARRALAILAEWFQTSLEHSVIRMEREAITGVSYTMVDNKLVKVKLSPAEVRQNAWAEMLKVIRQLPRQESQQVFFRAKEIANRNASLGYYDDLIDAITESIEQSSNQPTSYVYVSLADLHAFRAAPDWRVEYFKSVDSAARLLSSEPETASWYEDSVTEMYETAVDLDLVDEVRQVLINYGLEPGSDDGR